jgi:hypothetical protein
MRLRRVVIVNVLTVSGLGSLLLFLLGGGVVALRTRLLLGDLKDGDVVVTAAHPLEAPALIGAAAEIRKLGTAAIPTLLPYARDEGATDEHATYRILLLEVAVGESWQAPDDLLDLGVASLHSREPALRILAVGFLRSCGGARSFEALLAHARRLDLEGNGLERAYTLQTIAGLRDACEGPLQLDHLALRNESDLAAAPSWLEANRSHLPRQAGSR